jgi:signal transduction histidine kinase
MSLEDASMVLQNLSEVLIIAYPLILIVLFWLPVLLQEEVLNRLVLLSRLLILLPKIIWAPEFHYLKIEMSSMFCPKQLIIYLTESKTQSKEKRNLMLHMNWGPVDDYKRDFRGFNSEAAKFFRVREKINFCIYEVDRLNNLVDQLLLLARFENQKQSLKKEKIYLNTVILDSISRYSNIIQTKNIQVVTEFKRTIILKLMFTYSR